MKPYIQDPWSALGFHDALAGIRNARPPAAPTYLDLDDARRLTAYQILDSMATNTRRMWLPDSEHEARFESARDGLTAIVRPPAQSFREYGDSATLIDAARALVLGDDQEITADIKENDATGTAILEWVRSWGKSERIDQKLIQGETDCQKYGDAVYVVAPSSRAGRPKLRVYDPGMYFPDHDATVEGWDDDDYPPVVHIAWEYDDAQGVKWIRRSSWAMVPITPTAAPWGGQREWTCTFQTVDYRYDHLVKNATIYTDVMSSTSRVVNERRDLAIDFIPVVHVPSTPGAWGQSILTRVAQILDDIANTDTDTAQASQAAAPDLVVKGATPSAYDGRPNTMLGLDADGDAAWTDTSKNLDALLKFTDALMGRVAQNTRLGDVLLGRVSPADVPSGYAMSLGFHTARQLMRDMRTVRDEKFALILRFALRVGQARGWAPRGATPDLTIALGQSLPSDLEGAVTTVKSLLPVHGMSVATAVQILIDAGVPIADAEAEVAAIRREHIESIVQIVDATGDVQAARALLGLDALVAQAQQDDTNGGA